MGILPSGILGPIKNKTGAVIGRIHRGQNVITQLYKKRKRKRVRSKAQLASEYRLGQLSSFLSQIQVLVDSGFKSKVKHNTAVNAALSYNYDHAFIKVGADLELNYAKLVYSLGEVEGPESPEMAYKDGFLTLSWFDMPQSEYCQFSDKATILIYEPTSRSDIIFKVACQRSDLNVLLDILPFIDKEVHCYISFASSDGKRQGNSVYLGLVKTSI
ncbi:MAG: DUF6266 family protein [Pedobacter sp.]